MKYYFIINKWAGARHSAQTWRDIHQYLKQGKVDFEYVVTQYAQHATVLAHNFADQHPTGWVVVAIGGDGTLLEVLEGLRHAQNTVPLGYIPAGSGNDFARMVGLKREPYEALQQLIQTKEATILDIGAYRMNDDRTIHYFSNNIGIGFDASVVAYANAGQKLKLSKWHLESSAYISAILKSLKRQKGFPLAVTVDGKTTRFKEAFVVSLTNIKYFGGGVKIAPQARLNDGKLDVVITEKLSLFHFAHLFLKLLRSGQHLDMSEVFFKTGKMIHVQTEIPQPGQVNGEDIPATNFNLDIWLEKQPFWFTSNSSFNV